jgi:hypothetical protein
MYLFVIRKIRHLPQASFSKKKAGTTYQSFPLPISCKINAYGFGTMSPWSPIGAVGSAVWPFILILSSFA